MKITIGKGDEHPIAHLGINPLDDGAVNCAIVPIIGVPIQYETLKHPNDTEDNRQPCERIQATGSPEKINK